MGQGTNQLLNHRKAREKLSDLIIRADQIIVVHYSCESFYERPNGSSPRITSLAALNLASGQTKSFSIHQVAERLGYNRDELESHYNDLEKIMLTEFYDYVRFHSTHTWLHWNMRDINFGFQALAHRLKVLGGEPTDIAEAHLIDLSRLLMANYGEHYIGHPRLEKLIEKNETSHPDFLNGRAEADAFKNKEYVKLHQSTLRKVDTLANIIERAGSGLLKTNSKWKERYGSYPIGLAEHLRENRLITLISFLLGIVSAVLTMIEYFRH